MEENNLNSTEGNAEQTPKVPVNSETPISQAGNSSESPKKTKFKWKAIAAIGGVVAVAAGVIIYTQATKVESPPSLDTPTGQGFIAIDSGAEGFKLNYDDVRNFYDIQDGDAQRTSEEKFAEVAAVDQCEVQNLAKGQYQVAFSVNQKSIGEILSNNIRPIGYREGSANSENVVNFAECVEAGGEVATRSGDARTCTISETITNDAGETREISTDFEEEILDVKFIYYTPEILDYEEGFKAAGITHPEVTPILENFELPGFQVVQMYVSEPTQACILPNYLQRDLTSESVEVLKGFNPAFDEGQGGWLNFTASCPVIDHIIENELAKSIWFYNLESEEYEKAESCELDYSTLIWANFNEGVSIDLTAEAPEEVAATITAEPEAIAPTINFTDIVRSEFILENEDSFRGFVNTDGEYAEVELQIWSQSDVNESFETASTLEELKSFEVYSDRKDFDANSLNVEFSIPAAFMNDIGAGRWQMVAVLINAEGELITKFSGDDFTIYNDESRTLPNEIERIEIDLEGIQYDPDTFRDPISPDVTLDSTLDTSDLINDGTIPVKEPLEPTTATGDLRIDSTIDPEDILDPRLTTDDLTIESTLDSPRIDAELLEGADTTTVNPSILEQIDAETQTIDLNEPENSTVTIDPDQLDAISGSDSDSTDIQIQTIDPQELQIEGQIDYSDLSTGDNTIDSSLLLQQNSTIIQGI